MIRNRSAAIIVKDGKILLMHRRNNGHEYFSFPGGGVEAGETNEEACAREISEETTLTIKVKELVCKASWDDGSNNYYYVCDYVSGEPHLDPNAIEVEKMKSGKQYWNPEWKDISKMPNLLVYPLEVRDPIIKGLKKGFPKNPTEIFIIAATKRSKI